MTKTIHISLISKTMGGFSTSAIVGLSYKSMYLLVIDIYSSMDNFFFSKKV